ncbi:MAG TPA: ion transporter, partial [Gemmatimonadaceae bacterium]|nr:ion transporter [Gemmatimonadaceae bacterium]
GVVWLGLLIVELVRGLNPVLAAMSTGIWVVFIADFALRLFLAPDRWLYVRKSWLTAVSLVVPALRIARLGAVFRAARLARATRGMRLVRTIASLNRGLGALGTMMHRRGAWYVLGLVAVVCVGGAAGMYALEPESGEGGFSSYGDALWWTVMIMTTMGSGYWPQTAEGRILAVMISLVAIGVFGYFTAMLASFLVGRDAVTQSDGVAAASELRAVRREIAELRRELVSARPLAPSPPSRE